MGNKASQIEQMGIISKVFTFFLSAQFLIACNAVSPSGEIEQIVGDTSQQIENSIPASPNEVELTKVPSPNPSKQSGEFLLLVNRRTKQLKVFAPQGNLILQTFVGVGRGGLKAKKNLADLVTPKGEMEVDLILYENPRYNQIAPSLKNKYLEHKDYQRLVKEPNGLKNLFDKMNSLDFDLDGVSDRAYGVGYIGLNSSSVVTGPKMWHFQGVPYWFSIALHGTPDEEENIGRSNSGGCIHLPSTVLRQMIEQEIVSVGTKVVVTD